MSGIRTQVKAAIKNTLSGVSGIGTIFTNLPRNQQGNTFPSIVIMLEDTNEEVATMGSPQSKRHIRFHVSLYIQTIDYAPDDQASQQTFEDMLDSIDTALRADRTLGGTVLKSGLKIDTKHLTPQLAGQGQAILMRSVKEFEVVVEIVG